MISVNKIDLNNPIFSHALTCCFRIDYYLFLVIKCLTSELGGGCGLSWVFVVHFLFYLSFPLVW